MKSLLMVLFVFAAVGCSSKEKIKEIDTKLEQKQGFDQGEVIGKKDSETYVLQKKEELASYLSGLQKIVYSQEEEIYGNAAYGNKGKYGVLEDCRIALRAKSQGKAEMPEPLERVIVSEDESKTTKKIGVDEKGKLVMLQEEELLSRIKRFEQYKKTYAQQSQWFDSEIKNCKVKLSNYTN